MAHLSILWMNKKAFKVTVVHYFENIGLEGKRNMGKGPKNIHVREGGDTEGSFFKLVLICQLFTL